MRKVLNKEGASDTSYVLRSPAPAAAPAPAPAGNKGGDYPTGIISLLSFIEYSNEAINIIQAYLLQMRS